MPTISGADSRPSSIVSVTIGVTGHRDCLEGQGKLRDEVKAELISLAEQWKGCNPVILTGLAEGADQLVAELAKQVGGGYDFQVVPVLPMPVAEYENDFESEDGALLKRFRSDLALCGKPIELPLIDDGLSSGQASGVTNRERQYENLGLYLATHCHVLIAIWDNKLLIKIGGTSCIVNMRLGGLSYGSPDALIKRPSPPSGYVIHIWTPRRSQPTVEGVPYSSRLLYPKYWWAQKKVKSETNNQITIEYVDPDENSKEGRKSRKKCEETLKRIRRNTMELNHDFAEQCTKYKQDIETSRHRLYEHGQPTSNDPIRADLENAYAVIDALAIRYRNLRVSTLNWLYGLVLAAFFCFQFQVEGFMPSAWPWFPFACYAVLFISVYGKYWRAKRNRYEEKHQDYRVLAESLRVQIFWRLSGISDSVIDHCVKGQVGELTWIRLALHSILLPMFRSAKPTVVEHNVVMENWVEGQGQYYKTKSLGCAEDTEATNNRCLALLGFCAALILFLGIAAWVSPCLFDRTFPLHWVVNLAIVLAGTSLALAAVFHQRANMLAIAEQAHSYNRMGWRFGLAEDALKQQPAGLPNANWKTILKDLGQDALTEHSDWLIMHRARPLDIPVL